MQSESQGIILCHESRLTSENRHCKGEADVSVGIIVCTRRLWGGFLFSYKGLCVLVDGCRTLGYRRVIRVTKYNKNNSGK